MIIAGKYEVLGKLGQGGQGSVYKVRHLGLDEIRALKVQPDHGIGEETVARFRREGRALARLRHAHIVQVFDLGRDADQYYLEMEYVNGPNLAQHLKANGRPPVLDALEIARHVADALTYAHEQPYVDSAGVQHTGMVHRDIKPSNILLRDQTPMYALLADFGLVKLGDPGERTTTGTMLGTYKYSAPEQLGLKRGRERVTVDFRADVFAFGLVLYELLEGRQFHAGLEPQEILARVLFEPDAMEPEFTVSVLPGLRALLRRMVQRDPENRPPNMKVVLGAIDEALSDLRGGDATTVVVSPHGRTGDGEPRTEEELEEQIRALMAERERRRAQAARGDAQIARARALDAGAVELATPEFETAVRREEEASFALSAGDLTHARELYELTSRLFGEAEAHAAAARERKVAEDARDAAGAAREAARAAGAPALGAGLWSAAAEREQAAVALLDAGDVGAARRAFDGVATAFRAARSAAETERERRRADAAAAASTASAARQDAEEADAAHHSSASWALAVAAVAEGDRHVGAGDDLEAAAAFRRARVAFADAARASLDAQARLAADAAHRAAAAAESAGADRFAADEYASARARLDAATAALAGGDARTARVLFADAAQVLDDVAALASRRREEEAARRLEEERRRQEEDAARRRAEEEAQRRAAEERARELAAARAAQAAAATAAERARAAGAEALAAPQLAAASARLAEADAALGRDALADAAAGFGAATAAFEHAEQAAVREAGRRRALAAREAATAGRAAAHRAEVARWAPELAREAEASWEAGEAAVAREVFADAEASFTDAGGLFEHAAGVARERADEARRLEEEARRLEAEEQRRRAEEEARQRAEAEEARRRAAEERARQLATAEAARTSASAAAGRARDAGAGDLAAVAMDAATAGLERAEAAIRRDALLEAVDLFTAAGAAFDAAAREAGVEAIRRRALGARAVAVGARERADESEAARWALDAWSLAEKHWTRAEAALAANRFDAAAVDFGTATTGFETAATLAREAATAERRRLEEEAARRSAEEERARQLAAVESSRVVASRAAGRARDAGAGELAAAALATASGQLAEAETAARREAFSEALQLFAAAGAGFDEAARAALVEAARGRALVAREQAASTRSDAQAAEPERWAAEAWQGAEARWTEAEAALAGAAFDEASSAFSAAASAFEAAAVAARAASEAQSRRQEDEARRRIEEETKRRAAEEESRRHAAAAEAERKRAAEVEARRRAAADAEREAEAEARRLAEAEAKRRADAEATRLAEEEAKRRAAEEAARRRAEEEARQAEAARRQAAAEERTRQLAAIEAARAATAAAAARARDAGAGELAVEVLAGATAQLADADAAVRREAFGDAAALFAAAGAAFDAAADAAVAEVARRQRQEQERARQAAEERQRADAEDARRRLAERRLADEAEARRHAEEEARRAEAAARARAREEAEELAARRAEEEAARTALDAEATVVLPPEEPTVVAPPVPTVPMTVIDEATVLEPPTLPVAATEAPVVPSVPSIAPPARMRWPYAAAAVLALALGLGYALLRSQPQQVTPPSELPRERTPTTSARVEPEQPPATTPPPTLPGLAWGTVSPPLGEPVTVKEGQRVRFDAAVAQADAQPGLDLRWLLDGKEVGHGASWEYAPGFSDGGRGRSVQIVATSEGRRLEQTWAVEVENVDRPPTIASVSPPEGAVTVETGAAQKFTLKASDPDEGDRLTYTWERNGKRVAAGAQPELTLRDVAEGEQLSVTVTDADGVSAGSRSWKMALKSPVPVEPQPPRIVGQTPPAKGRLAVEEGRAIEFSLKVNDPDPKEKLAYAWFVDGRPVGTGKTLRFEAPSLEERKVARRVEVEVTDAAGLKSGRVGWDLDVLWTPPDVTRLEPKDRTLTLEPGQTRELRAGATSPGKGALTYEWRVDGKVQQPTPSGRFPLPSDLPAGRHAVEVASIDPRGLRSEPLGWTIDVRAAPPPTVPVTTPATVPTTTPTTLMSRLPPTTLAPRVPPPTLPPTGAGPITQADVRDWLARYQSAMQSKDAAALVALGVTSGDRAQEIVSRLQIIQQVRVGNESVSIEGAGANVSFDRVDVDDRGKELQHPRKSCRLEKVGGTVVARGGCL